LINQKNKLIFSLAGISFLVIHFTATFFYVAPVEWTGNRLKSYSSFYILPLFHQQWSLFAPSPPTMNKKVKLTVTKENKETETVELFDNHQSWHDLIRFGASGRFILLKGNVLYSVHAEYAHYYELMKNKSDAVKELKKSMGGKAFKNLVKVWLENRFENLRDEKYRVDAEIIFENHKGTTEKRQMKSDTIHLIYQFVKEK
jgi:hypothetical protein